MPGGIGDLAVELPAALDSGRGADRRGDCGAAEVAVAEDLGLRLLAPPRGDLQGVRGGERHAPAGRDTAARELLRHAHERRGVELVAAVAARHVAAVEARIEEVLVELLGVVGALLGVRLRGDQLRPQRDRASDQLIGCEVGLGRRDRLAGASHGHRANAPIASTAGRCSW